MLLNADFYVFMREMLLAAASSLKYEAALCRGCLKAAGMTSVYGGGEVVAMSCRSAHKRAEENRPEVNAAAMENHQPDMPIKWLILRA